VKFPALLCEPFGSTGTEILDLTYRRAITG
jgi:hypothetical protein